MVKGRGKTKRAYFWGYRGDENHPFNVFDFTETHSRDGPLRFLRRDGAESNPQQMFRGYGPFTSRKGPAYPAWNLPMAEVQ